ncbi:MAG: flagellar biosynthetic protein FliO [Pseudomonadota bacterium]
MSELWQLAGSLLLVVMLVVALGAVAKRLRGVPTGGGSSVKIVESVFLGPKERLVVIEYDHRRILLGINPGSITRIGEQDAPGLSQDTVGDSHG